MIIAALTVWCVVVIYKCLHAIAVIRWLLRNGAEIARRAGRTDGTVDENRQAFWAAFEAESARDPLPAMLFDIKDIRLDRWEADLRARKRQVRLALLRLIRALWHATGIVTLTALLLFSTAYLPESIDPGPTASLFAVGLAVLLLMFLLGVEMVVLVATIGPWVPYYHRLDTKGKYRPEDSEVREKMRLLYVSAGAAIMTLVSMAAVIAFSSRRSGSVNLVIDDNPLLGVIQSFAHAVTVLGTVGEGLDPSTFYGAILSLFLLPVVLTYIAFLVPIAASVVDWQRDR